MGWLYTVYLFGTSRNRVGQGCSVDRSNRRAEPLFNCIDSCNPLKIKCWLGFDENARFNRCLFLSLMSGVFFLSAPLGDCLNR